MSTCPNPPPLLPSRSFLWICRSLCAVALAISGYLAWTAFHAGDVYGCGGGEVFDCGHVLNSRYAKIFGVPVSVPAFGLYATLLSLLTFFLPAAPEKLLKVGWGILTFGGISAGLAALWFTGVQVFVLHHLCFYCLIAHACGLTLAAMVLWRRPFTRTTTSQLAAFSILGVAGLITGQMMAEPPQTFTVETYDNAVNVSGEQQTTFEAPGATEEFGAPIEFGASVEFAAPTEFAPPTEFAAPVEFTPPGFETVAADGADTATEDSDVSDEPGVEAIKVKTSVEPIQAVQPTTSTDTATPQNDKSDATTSLPPSSDDGKITATETRFNVVAMATEPMEPKPAAMRPTLPGTAYLYFAASGRSAATHLLTAFSGLVAASSEPAADEGAAQPETANKAVAAAKAKHSVAKPVTATPQRVVTVAGKRFSLNTRHWPLLGDPDAKYVFVEMFDYTCVHCRKTHQAIEGAFDQYGDELAIIALPVPLERSCNAYAKGSGHAGACEQARLGVAVWRCDRSRFRDFHHWMFEAQRTTAQARLKAEQLVGKDKLAAELALPHATAYISRHVDLYQKVGQGAVPKLMFPTSTMTGQVASTATLCSTIERELAGGK